MVGRRALVTGATGGLGRVLVPALLSAGYTVRATGRNREIGAALRTEGVDFAAADLAADDLAPLVEKIDTVFHLAALSSPWGRQADFEAANVRATTRLLDAARRAGCDGFLYASTPSIYAEARHRLDIAEGDPPARRFANAYAETKFRAETAVLAANGPGFRALALRPRAIVGRFDTVLLPRLRRAAAKGRLVLPGRGDTLLELTDARDVAAAFLAAATALESAQGRAFNISGGQPRPLRGLLEMIFREVGQQVDLVSIPVSLALGIARCAETVAALLPGRPEPPATLYSVMVFAFSQTFDLSAAAGVLGWTPRYSPEEAVRAAVAERNGNG